MLALVLLLSAGEPPLLSPIPLTLQNGAINVTGKIDGGKVIPLGWAQNSAVACFPGNHFDSFAGKHVLYRFDLPAKSIANITLKPSDPKSDVNLYVYRAAVGETLLPPAIYGTQCEASYGSAVVGTKPNGSELDTVEMWAIANPYTIYVGVAGYKGVQAGGFELNVSVKTAPPPKSGKISTVTDLQVKPGRTTVTGSIDGGTELDLDWAQNSAVACFPGNHFDAFSGKHVLYRFTLPAKSIAKIALVPKGGGGDLNLYSYRAALGEKLLPPEINGTQCEASYKTARVGVQPNPGETEKTEMWAIANPYTIYVGVAGYKGVLKGAFDLQIDLQTAPPPKTGKITKVTDIQVKPGITTVSGAIDNGVEIDLDWAQGSAVACFPGNHFDAFAGKHVAYRFDLPAKSVAKIQMIPKGPGDLNLYTYRAAKGELLLPPAIYGTQCEASYKMGMPFGVLPNPGEPENTEMWAISNPYTIYVIVAGYKGVTTGGFEIKVDLTTAAPPKTGRITSFTPLQVKPGRNTFAGKIDGGVEIDLDWAQNSAVACFPGNHFESFDGKHVLYRFDLPAKSQAKISLTSKNGKDVNLYAYRAAVGEKLIPPEIYGTQCEADYGQAVVGTKPNPTEVDEVEMVSIASPYSIYVGVAGYKGITAADFTLTVDLKTVAPAKTGRITSFTPLQVKPGKNSFAGKIDGGVEIDLDWAQGSAVACFPGNHFPSFNGKHVLYRFDLPAQSQAKISLTSKAGKDVNLYAYRAALGERLIPPDIYGTQCEADYGQAVVGTKPNPEEVDTVEMVAIANPYSIYVGVAGFEGITAADFTLDIDLKTAAPEKTGSVTNYGSIPVALGKVTTIQGKIDGGVEIPLTWAESSNVACFGGHRFVHFDGKHVLYRFDQPKGSSLAVKLTPQDPSVDLSLYVYRVMHGDTTSLPPKVYMAKCEASFGKSDALVSPNPGEVESVDQMITMDNPYTVYVGVAGAKGVTAGAFSLDVDLKPR